MTVARPVRAGELLLRAFTAADAAQVETARRDPAIALWNPMRKPAEQWCVDRGDWSDGTHASWAAVRPERPETLVGAVSLHQIDHDQLDAEVGFFVLPAFRRQGIAAACLEMATAFAFTELGLRRTHLFHAVENVASCAVATACGYLLEGTHRESYRCGDGVWHDEHSHGRLASDTPPEL